MDADGSLTYVAAGVIILFDLRTPLLSRAVGVGTAVPSRRHAMQTATEIDGQAVAETRLRPGRMMLMSLPADVRGLHHGLTEERSGG